MSTVTMPEFADAVASYIYDQMFPPHRGVVEVTNPHGARRLVVLFGNDSYLDDDRTKRYADRLLAQLCAWGFEAQFGTSEDGYTWAIVVWPKDECGDLCPESFEQDFYDAYRHARGFTHDDGMVLAMASIHKREIVEHTNGRPITIPGWESVN